MQTNEYWVGSAGYTFGVCHSVHANLMTYGWIDDMLEATLHHAAKMQSMHGGSSLEAHGALSLAQKADTDGLLEDYWEQARDDTEPLPRAREMLDEIG